MQIEIVDFAVASPCDGASTRQTLRSCVQWSYDLCSPQEQLLWARPGVFAGSVDLDAAEGVCAGDDLAPENVLEVVASLVDKSILIPEQGPVVRYRLLDTIREFGRERLHQTGEYEALRRRHRDWYADFVTRADADWIGPRQRDWLTRLDREHPNIRAALEFSLTEPGEAQTALRMAAALHWYWFHLGGVRRGPALARPHPGLRHRGNRGAQPSALPRQQAGRVAGRPRRRVGLGGGGT